MEHLPMTGDTRIMYFHHLYTQKHMHSTHNPGTCVHSVAVLPYTVERRLDSCFVHLARVAWTPVPMLLTMLSGFLFYIHAKWLDIHT